MRPDRRRIGRHARVVAEAPRRIAKLCAPEDASLEHLDRDQLDLLAEVRLRLVEEPLTVADAVRPALAGALGEREPLHPDVARIDVAEVRALEVLEVVHGFCSLFSGCFSPSSGEVVCNL